MHALDQYIEPRMFTVQFHITGTHYSGSYQFQSLFCPFIVERFAGNQIVPILNSWTRQIKYFLLKCLYQTKKVIGHVFVC